LVALVGLLAGSASHVAAGPIGWAVGDGGTILHTSDGGTTWTAQTSGTTNLLSLVEFTDANTGWAVGVGGTILHTSNGGTTWTAQTSGTTNFLTGVEFLNEPEAVPEPGSLALLASVLASLALPAWTRRRRG
jgi:photosystem II stability/assembly factor-like uncharacterized protein